jgi:tetratricopeptide (TPR) repeat protein
VIFGLRRQFAACLISIFCLCNQTLAATTSEAVKRLESQINEAMSHGDYDAVIRSANDALRVSPNSAGLRFACGLAYYRKGDLDTAVRNFDEAIRLQPTFARAYVLRGSSYALKSDYNKALADFDQAIRIDPRNAAAYCDRADIEEQSLSRPDEAVADYNHAIRLAPNFQRAYFNRGVHFLGRHDYGRAIADFNLAIQLMPNDLDAYAYRACAYAKQGDRAHALADATVAVKLRPMKDSLPRSVNLATRGRAYRILGQAEAALHDLREAVRLAPERSTANDNLAWFLATCPNDRFRNGTEAVSVAKKACELSDWKRSGCHDTLAVAYAEAGDFDQAVKYEKQAVNDSSLAPKEREERENRLALFQQRKPFRDEF